MQHQHIGKSDDTATDAADLVSGIASAHHDLMAQLDADEQGILRRVDTAKREAIAAAIAGASGEKLKKILATAITGNDT